MTEQVTPDAVRDNHEAVDKILSDTFELSKCLGRQTESEFARMVADAAYAAGLAAATADRERMVKALDECVRLLIFLTQDSDSELDAAVIRDARSALAATGAR